jgi:hypothetical protein
MELVFTILRSSVSSSENELSSSRPPSPGTPGASDVEAQPLISTNPRISNTAIETLHSLFIFASLITVFIPETSQKQIGEIIR